MGTDNKKKHYYHYFTSPTLDENFIASIPYLQSYIFLSELEQLHKRKLYLYDGTFRNFRFFEITSKILSLALKNIQASLTSLNFCLAQYKKQAFSTFSR